MSTTPRRVSVVGTSGSGKTTLAAQVAEHLGLPHVELDAFHHLPGWETRPFEEMLPLIREHIGDGGWVIDGNYRLLTMDGPFWQEADMVVWLDLPRRTIIRRVATRTIWRVLTRKELWSGNREPFSNLLRWSRPEDNIILWSWTTFTKNRQRYETASSDPRFKHLTFVRLSSAREARAWLRSTITA